MKRTIISVTEAARNFADCVNRVRYQNVEFVLVKNGLPVARLVPNDEKASTGRELAKVLARVKLSPNNAKTWHSDLRTAHRILKAPPKRWR